MIKVLHSKEEKQLTIPLYRQAFQDTEAFISYYYQEKCRDNLIVVKEENGAILSMAHLNPYTMMVYGIPYPVYYVVAVATDADQRRQGHMREVLNAAFRVMQERKIPFCYLMPASIKLYEGLGFEVICDFNKNRDLCMDQIKKHFDLYCQQDETYLRYREAEKEFAMNPEDGTQQEGLPEPAVILAKIMDKTSFAAMSGLDKTAGEIKMLQWLREKRIYICEEV